MTSRLVSMVAVVALLVVACGADETTATDRARSTTVESSVPVSEPPVSGPSETTSATAGAPATTSDTPVTTGEAGDDGATTANAAPDFTLQLGDGATFVLSQEAKPVFMVFWAEW